MLESHEITMLRSPMRMLVGKYSYIIYMIESGRALLRVVLESPGILRHWFSFSYSRFPRICVYTMNVEDAKYNKLQFPCAIICKSKRGKHFKQIESNIQEM